LGVGKKRLVSHHMHNVGGSVPELVRLARDEKKAIALVTDAGTPGRDTHPSIP
jgi:16S rRNA C1402 (ribose-2'-O) methylase RsmI